MVKCFGTEFQISFVRNRTDSQFFTQILWIVLVLSGFCVSAIAQVKSGGRMQDCSIPQGPITYNIGSTNGSGARCNAKSIVVGFQGSFRSLPRGVVGMGYINPLLENQQMRSKFGANSSNSSMGNARYNETKFHSYANANAKAYIRYQANHWKKMGAARGQKCVAVDIDNCDVIGSKNYSHVIATINEINRADPAGVKIKVLVKNPQNGCGNFMKNPDVVGAFIEELSSGELARLKKLRANPDQVLLFAQGDSRGSGHISLQSIANQKIPNTSVSFDRNGMYGSINRCTYTKPRANPALTSRAPASLVSRAETGVEI